MKYTCIDSFSGAGGLSIGLKNAGYDILLSFDNDTFCINTQLQNPQYINHKAMVIDITKVEAEELLNLSNLKKGELFLFAGGPPCQGFSIQRIGKDEDDRNSLIQQYIEKVVAIDPQFFLMENVPGITGKRGRQLLNDALQQAKNHGYFIHEKILNAQDFGVPQRRKRLIIVGEKLQKDAHPTFTFPEPITGLRNTVKSTISTLPEPPNDGKDHPLYKHHRRDRLSSLNLQRIRALRQGQGRDHLPEELLADCHKVDSSVMGHRNVYGRMSWDDVAPTITARFDSFTRGLFGHPEQDRSITLREGALLQTFPLDYIFSGSKVDIARQIGNAVPPKLAEIIGLQIINCYQKRTS
jgi:DNA (cytosine-5)-methyltransferase 1